MNAVQKTIRKSKMEIMAIKQQKEFWPDITDEDLWNSNRKGFNDGWMPIPRTMSLIMNIIDDLSKNQPASRAYFVLWCYRRPESSLVTIENPSVFAAETGFSGERALTTWKQRMKILQELGFIDAKEGSSGAFHYVLILNPHVVIQKLKSNIQESRFRQIYSRALDIGAKDFETSHE
ncbi:MAG: hypothetical protein QX189_07510 [Methylococcales bacterium]